MSGAYEEPDWAEAPTTDLEFQILKDHHEVGVLPITQDKTKAHLIFGRVPQLCDHVMSHPSTSRQHAVIQFGINSQVFVFDMSTHGVVLDNERVPARDFAKVPLGAALRFGGSSRQYVLRKAGTVSTVPRKSSQSSSSSRPVQEPALDAASLRRQQEYEEYQRHLAEQEAEKAKQAEEDQAALESNPYAPPSDGTAVNPYFDHELGAVSSDRRQHFGRKPRKWKKRRKGDSEEAHDSGDDDDDDEHTNVFTAKKSRIRQNMEAKVLDSDLQSEFSIFQGSNSTIQEQEAHYLKARKLAR